MTLTPPQLVHRAHGLPVVAGCSDGKGLCYVCVGAVTRGKTKADWLSGSFTDQNRVRCPGATHVCEACCFVTSRISPVLGRPAGSCKVCDGSGAVVRLPPKGKGSKSKVGDPCPKCEGRGAADFAGNFRNFSSLYEEGWSGVAFGQSGALPCYANASKGEKPLIRDFLARRHGGVWFAAIADSGQKHVLPFAPMNGPGVRGNVLFEEMIVPVPADQSLVPDATALLTAGVTKDEIISGSYYPRTWAENELQVREFERQHSGERNSGWFTLALWLSQRNEEEHARRTEEKKTRDAAGRATARPAKRVHERPRRKAPAVVLGDFPSANASRSQDDGKRKRVGDADAAQATNPKLTQQRLFDFD